MSLSIGIVGLPNVGKSTLFRALTKKAVAAENFPFCTIDPSVGVVAVPDYRLNKLAELSQSAKTIPAAVEFVDIAGLVEGAHEGEGMGNEFLTHIREVDAIAQVVRIFEDEDVHHVRGEINPSKDVEIINLELILADLKSVQSRSEKNIRDVRSGDKQAVILQSALDKVRQALEAGLPARTVDLSEDEQEQIAEAHLLTMKPQLYVLNRKSGDKNLDELDDGRFTELLNLINRTTDAGYVTVDAGIEDEIRDFEGEEKDEFRKQLGSNPDNGVDSLITAGYDLLDLITFFTTGEAETRGWQISKGSTAPQAGGAIHTDFTDKFIKADVVAYNDLVESGSYAKAREVGKVRTEGKEYVVADGDVIIFKI